MSVSDGVSEYSYTSRGPDHSVSHRVITMANTRVQSKNLFNFRPQGFVDEDIVAFDQKMKTDYNLDLVAMSKAMENQSEQEFIAGMRANVEGYLDTSSFIKGPAYEEVKNPK